MSSLLTLPQEYLSLYRNKNIVNQKNFLSKTELIVEYIGYWCNTVWYNHNFKTSYGFFFICFLMENICIYLLIKQERLYKT